MGMKQGRGWGEQTRAGERDRKIGDPRVWILGNTDTTAEAETGAPGRRGGALLAGAERPGSHRRGRRRTALGRPGRRRATPPRATPSLPRRPGGRLTQGAAAPEPQAAAVWDRPGGRSRPRRRDFPGVGVGASPSHSAGDHPAPPLTRGHREVTLLRCPGGLFSVLTFGDPPCLTGSNEVSSSPSSRKGVGGFSHLSASESPGGFDILIS